MFELWERGLRLMAHSLRVKLLTVDPTVDPGFDDKSSATPSKASDTAVADRPFRGNISVRSSSALRGLNGTR